MLCFATLGLGEPSFLTNSFYRFLPLRITEISLPLRTKGDAWIANPSQAKFQTKTKAPKAASKSNPSPPTQQTNKPNPSAVPELAIQKQIQVQLTLVLPPRSVRASLPCNSLAWRFIVAPRRGLAGAHRPRVSTAKAERQTERRTVNGIVKKKKSEKKTRAQEIRRS